MFVMSCYMEMDCSLFAGENNRGEVFARQFVEFRRNEMKSKPNDDGSLCGHDDRRWGRPRLRTGVQ